MSRVEFLKKFVAFNKRHNVPLWLIKAQLYVILVVCFIHYAIVKGINGVKRAICYPFIKAKECIKKNIRTVFKIECIFIPFIYWKTSTSTTIIFFNLTFIFIIPKRVFPVSSVVFLYILIMPYIFNASAVFAYHDNDNNKYNNCNLFHKFFHNKIVSYKLIYRRPILSK